MTNYRKGFTQRFFKFLEDKKYALLKWDGAMEALIEEGSDLDILVEKKDIPSIIAYAKNQPEILKTRIDYKPDVTHLFLMLWGGAVLQIDLLTSLQRKEIEYGSCTNILANTQKINGIKTYSTTAYFEHVVLFSFLNNSGISQKHFEKFNKMGGIEKLVRSFNKRFDTNFSNLEALKKFDPNQKTQIINALKNRPENCLLNRLERKATYAFATLKQILNPSGSIITFSGVDGAGKSTILTQTAKMLENQYRKNVVVLRHRPSVFPILSALTLGKKAAEKKSMATLPRTGKKQGMISSAIRFAYYFLDYQIGQIYIHCKYVSKGYVVLYDRYYFDFILDGRRTSIDLGTALPKFLYKFIYKPTLNIFLFADAETILKRKQELSASVIEKLTAKYKSLFNDFSKKHNGTYLTVNNINLNQTIEKIRFQFLNQEFS